MASDDRIAATETAFEILDAVHESQGATAAELIEATDLSRGGVYKHLRTLVAVDALVNHDGVYALGPKFTEYSLGAAEVYPVLDQTDKVDELAQSLDAPTNLWANDADNCLCVYTALPSDREDYPRRRGDSEPLVKSPPGKVILARTADERRSELTRRHDDELQAQLEALREQQLLEEPLRFAPEWVSIATPVLDPSDQPVAALEVVVPAERANSIDVKNNVRGLLTETAHRIRVDML
jgi:DNA-binding IclR family transcriptional regulator